MPGGKKRSRGTRPKAASSRASPPAMRCANASRADAIASIPIGMPPAILGGMRSTRPLALLPLLLLLLLPFAGCAHRAAVAAPPAAPPPQAIATEYDLIYAFAHARMSSVPSPFLVATVAALPHRGGAALDIGGGSGRNSFYLARQGYRVTDVDLSHVGLDLAQQAVAVNHLPVSTVAADINQYDLGVKRWDMIALIDFPFAYRPLLPRIAAALKPGGTVVIQAVSTKQPGIESPDHSVTYTFM